MNVNWRGIGIVEENVLFLVDLKKNNFKKLQSNIKSESNIDDAFIPYCKRFEDELKEGKYLFTADLLEDGTFEATNRATYADWIEDDKDYQYYIDCAEHDERVLFHNVVNKSSGGNQIMNSRIKTQIKKAIGDQLIEKEHQCPVCNRKTKHKLNFKIDQANCKVCNNSSSIEISEYESIYKDLKKIGVQF